MGLTLYYADDKDGVWKYRRVVPKHLKRIIKKGEFKKTLGKTREEALNAYLRFHAEVEKTIRNAELLLAAEASPQDVHALTKLELYLESIAKVRRMGFDPLDATVDPDDPVSVMDDNARTLIADQILEDYPKNPETGEPVGLRPLDEMVVQTLYSGAPPTPEPTLDDAKKLYIAEKITGSDFEIKKKTQRLERILGHINDALGRPPTIPRFTRSDAKLVRDYLLSLGSLKPSSVKRELNVVKAMFNHIITETQLVGVMNPFTKLPIAGLNEDPEDELRDPLPDDILKSIRRSILGGAKEELQLIWRLLEGTGCRLAEVTGLRVEDVVIEDELPHLVVTWHEGRRIKNKASKRAVPLVGDALDAAQEALELAKDRKVLFVSYAGEKGPGNASQALMKHVRRVTEDPAHAVHSLRHNMKDRLILAEAPEMDQNLILGHSLGGVGDRTYGGSRMKLRATTRAMRRAFMLTEADLVSEAAE